MKNNQLKAGLPLFLVLTVVFFSSFRPDEGMFPLSHIQKIDLKKAGFELSEKELFNPDSISLTNALVRIGGCSGSFISDEGLIITNHHCVFGAVSRVSDVENNYLEEGFMAQNKESEIPVGIECKITRSYEDVSEKILKGTENIEDGKLKTLKIKENIQALIKEESEQYPDFKIEISEMFMGRSYVLFRYEILKDTRLVYVPHRKIGEFGGETDNWEWPRHTGDFAIVRAYADSNNQAAEFSEENVPYKPAKHLEINAEGIDEESLVFIMGFPGRTYRHQPSGFIQYQYEHVLPFISEWFDFKINHMLNLSRGAQDEARYLEFASTIKRLANVKKNFEGKMQGISRTRLLDSKKQEDARLDLFAQELKLNPEFVNNPILHSVKTLDTLYTKQLQIAHKELILNYLKSDVGYFATALEIAKILDAAPQIPRAQLDSFWEATATHLRKFIDLRFKEHNHDLEFLFFENLVYKAESINTVPLNYLKANNKEAWLRNLYSNHEKDREKWLKILEKKPHKLVKASSPMIDFARYMLSHYHQTEEAKSQINSGMAIWLPRYTELKYIATQEDFVPDANATLRLTYGYIRGYSPNDGEYHYPFTSINGILEKAATENPDYFLPDNLINFFQNATYPVALTDRKTGKPVVCMLYNLDTTGGNSGSPVMDSKGRLVGVNFDRTFTATINDYAWNEKYSRSIAVDIRYVLFILKEFSGADALLDELGVKL